MIRLYRFPLSTNVERVALALAHKGLPVESVEVDPEDRSAVRRVSGQDLVPVIEDEGKVVCDSTAILLHLEARHPEPPLFPGDPARRAEMMIFIDWFNRVWKRAPNELETEMGRPEPDAARIARLGREMTGHLGRFEAMLAGRDYLMGEFSAADCAAFPFLRFGLFLQPDDPWLFHKILAEHQPLGEDHPRLSEYVRRMDRRPRA